MSDEPVDTGATLPSARGLSALFGKPASSCGCGGQSAESCPSCATANADTGPVFAYALGRIRPRIPNLGLEKEIAQTVGRVFTDGSSDEEALCKLLADPEHRRLAYEVCWTLEVDGADAFVIRPADTLGLSLILATVRPDKGQRSDMDVVIGRLMGRGGLTECAGKMLPALIPAQVYSMDRAALLKTLPEFKGIGVDAVKSAVKQTLDITAEIAGNFGISPAHRALNYAITRCAEVYQTVAAQLLDNSTLSGISTRRSALAGARTLVDVVLTFRHRVSDGTRKFYLRVDVTDLYPFMATALRPYLELG